jgi:hypothetical protein
MASTSPPRSAADSYDVYISYSRADLEWAERLSRDLAEFGLRCFIDLNVSVGDSWSEALNQALIRSGALVVIWSPAAVESKGVLSEIAGFEALTLREDRQSLVFPVVLGGDETLRTAPPQLSSRQAVIVGRDAYAAGASADSVEWTRAVREIALAVRDSSELEPPDTTLDQPPAATALPSFSTAARRALTFAVEMLGGEPAPASRLRTAALLGALRASVAGGMTPTTGDVMRLVLERQSSGRSAEEVLAAAESAAGLNPVRDHTRDAMSVVELTRSGVRELVYDAVQMQARTNAASVHLRHVLATGVHPAVSADALTELGVTMPELRAAWRESIARTWPDESKEGWDDILLERVAAERFTTAPPSARVHADLWTTDDRLDYALYAKAIAEFIRHPDAKPPMVISVQAPWGQGKTSLMRMVQRDLDPGHPDLRNAKNASGLSSTPEPPSELTFGDLRDSLDGTGAANDVKPEAIRTVWFNAWKYQSTEQIWAGLAHAILAQLPARLSVKDRELFWLRLQRRRIDPSAVRSDIYRAALERFLPRLAGWAVLALGTLIVVGLSLLAGGLGAAGVGIAGGGVIGALWVARRAWASATRDVLNRKLEGAYLRYVRQPDYGSKLGYLHLVEEDMTRALALLTPDDQPAVIFIDDLDRCSPAKIAEVIEAMNLFLAGDYPNCAFVIGLDAEVVAASMEVVHEQIIGKLDDRRGELGWRFMDKFVQLPFVMPRLHPQQREAYLRGLFSTPHDDKETHDIVTEAEQLQNAARQDALPVDELARRVADLAPRLAGVDPERARSLGEEVVSAGARAFSDNDPEVIQALADQMGYLSDNPRTIKRAVNLYRFHRFVAFARQASTLPLEVATPEQIGRWIVVIIRWPQFVRWLQTQTDERVSPPQNPAGRAVAIAGKADTSQAFKVALSEEGIDAPWAEDVELWEFLRAETHPDLRLHLAGPRGLW